MRIAGVEVGKVTKVERVSKGNDAAMVTMTVGKAGRPIHDDARAKIRPRIFLEGNFFVDLEPGTPGAREIEDEGTIPINQTAVPVQFDQLLTSLQSDTREDLKTLLDEYGNALDKGGAEGFNRSIPYWKSAYRDTAIVNEASLGETEHDLSGYVDNAGATAAALDRNPEQLKSLITDFNTTANAFAREQGNLRTAIAELPRTLRAAQPALASLNDVVPVAAGVHRGPAAGRALLGGGARRVDPVRAPAARPRLRGRAARPRRRPAPDDPRARAPLAREHPAGRAEPRCWRAARTRPSSSGRTTRSRTSSSRPRARCTPRRRRRSPASPARAVRVTPTASGSASSPPAAPTSCSSRRACSARTLNPILGSNPPKQQTRPPLDNSQPCENQENPDLRSQPGDPPQQWKADTSTKAFKDRYALARGRAVDWLEDQLKREELSDKFKVTEKDATKSLIDELAGGITP